MSWQKLLKSFANAVALLFCGSLIVFFLFGGLSRIEPQVRSKVSRVKADLRTMRTALEAYAVDYHAYPPAGSRKWGGRSEPYNDPLTLPGAVTTPIAYLTQIPEDPFNRRAGRGSRTNCVYLPLSWLRSATESEEKLREFQKATGHRLKTLGKDDIENFESHFGEFVLWSCGPAGRE